MSAPQTGTLATGHKACSCLQTFKAERKKTEVACSMGEQWRPNAGRSSPAAHQPRLPAIAFLWGLAFPSCRQWEQHEGPHFCGVGSSFDAMTAPWDTHTGQWGQASTRRGRSERCGWVGGGRQISALFGRVSNSGVLPFFPRLGTSPVTFRQQRARTHLDAAHTYVPASACTAVRGGTRTRAPNPSPPRAAHAATGARARLRARAPARAGKGGRGRGRRGGARERAS